MRGQTPMLYRYAILDGRTLLGIMATYEQADDVAMFHEVCQYTILGRIVKCEILTIGYGGLLRYGGDNGYSSR